MGHETAADISCKDGKVKELLGVLSSDSVNRYGTRFTIGALNDMFNEKNRLGLPTLVSHDAHRLIGWTEPLCLYLDGSITKVFGKTILAESSDDSKKLIERYDTYNSYRQKSEFEPHRLLFDREIGEFAQTAEPIFLECAAYRKEGIAAEVFRDIFLREDDDGLISLSELNEFSYLGAGVFKKGNLCIFAHQFFRRSLSLANNTNFFFLDFFINLSGKGINKKIRLDKNLVGFSPSFREPMELEYWWGPKYDDNLSTIEPGVARHSASESEQYYHSILHTDFWWQSRKNDHIFEMEEIRTSPTFSKSFRTEQDVEEEFGCRYVHSIINEKSRKIEHLDGSIRIYSTEEMCERIDVDISKVKRKLKYFKLWRIDGDISLSDWKSLIHHYYANNRLVGEYLGMVSNDPIDDDVKVENKAADDINSTVRELVPYGMTESSGVRVGLSYSKRIPRNSAVLIESRDNISSEDGVFAWTINSFTHEILKLMRKNKIQVDLRQQCWTLSYQDGYVDLPIFQFAEVKSEIIAYFEAIKEATSWSLKTGFSRVFNIAFSWPINDELDAEVSLLGTDKVILSYIEELLAGKIVLPKSFEDVERFFERSKDFNKKFNLEPSPDQFKVVMKETGMVKCRRVRIDNDIKVSFYRDPDSRLMFRMAIPKNKSGYVEAINKKGLNLAMMVKVNKAECSVCNDDYYKCDHTRSTDRAVSTLSKTEALAVYWTDRPVS
jgi:hypothetical protein